MSSAQRAARRAPRTRCTDFVVAYTKATEGGRAPMYIGGGVILLIIIILLLVYLL